MQIEITMRSHLTSIRKAKTKRLTTPNIGENVTNIGAAEIAADGTLKWYN